MYLELLSVTYRAYVVHEAVSLKRNKCIVPAVSVSDQLKLKPLSRQVFPCAIPHQSDQFPRLGVKLIDTTWIQMLTTSRAISFVKMCIW